MSFVGAKWLFYILQYASAIGIGIAITPLSWKLALMTAVLAYGMTTFGELALLCRLKHEGKLK